MAIGLDYFNKCPIEILVEIFQMYLTTSHHHIRRLLLVCKKWYKLVMNTPSLWNRINVRFPDPSDGRSLRFIPYVQACKQRSEDLKLEVTLNFEAIGDAEDYHNDVIWSHIHGECADCLFEGLNPHYSHQSECTIYEQRKEEVINTVRALVGEDSKDMARWSSFDLTLPYMNGGIKEIAPALFLLDGSTNSLHNLSIHNLGDWFDLSSDDEMFGQFPGLTDCSRVERLKLRRTNIDSIPVQYSSIKHLDIFINHERDLLSISNLDSLETLEMIVLGPSDSEVDLPRQNNVRLSFPCLRSMEITGDFDNDWFEALNFDTPLMRNFSLNLWEWHRPSGDPFDMKFPKISSRIVTFKAETARMVSSGNSRAWKNREFEVAFDQVLRHFSSAERIIFRLSTDEIIRRVLLDRIISGQQCPTVYMEKRGDLFRLHHAGTI
jgi:hypothetical protein